MIYCATDRGPNLSSMTDNVTRVDFGQDLKRESKPGG
jgi:hypothetical protein